MQRYVTVVSWTFVLVSLALAGCDDDGIFGPQCSATWPCDPGYVCDMVLYYCVPDPDAMDVDDDAADAGDTDGSGDTADTDTGDTSVGDTEDTTPPDTDLEVHRG